MKKIIALVLLLLMLVGCTGNEEKKEEKFAEFGDVVYIYYAVYYNDSGKWVLYETNIEEVAKENNYSLNNRGIVYMELSEKSKTLPALVRAIIKMKEGEKKEVILEPKDAYGEYNENLSFSIPRYKSESLFDEIPIVYFKIHNLSTENGTILKGKYWKKIVVNSTETTVYVKNLPEVNQTFVYYGLPARIIDVNDSHAYFELTPEVNKTYTTINNNNQKGKYRVVKITNSTIFFDNNHPLAGRELKIVIDLVKIIKG